MARFTLVALLFAILGVIHSTSGGPVETSTTPQSVTNASSSVPTTTSSTQSPTAVTPTPSIRTEMIKMAENLKSFQDGETELESGFVRLHDDSADPQPTMTTPTMGPLFFPQSENSSNLCFKPCKTILEILGKFPTVQQQAPDHVGQPKVFYLPTAPGNVELVLQYGNSTGGVAELRISAKWGPKSVDIPEVVETPKPTAETPTTGTTTSSPLATPTTTTSSTPVVTPIAKPLTQLVPNVIQPPLYKAKP